MPAMLLTARAAAYADAMRWEDLDRIGLDVVRGGELAPSRGLSGVARRFRAGEQRRRCWPRGRRHDRLGRRVLQSSDTTFVSSRNIRKDLEVRLR